MAKDAKEGLMKGWSDCKIEMLEILVNVEAIIKKRSLLQNEIQISNRKLDWILKMTVINK